MPKVQESRLSELQNALDDAQEYLSETHERLSEALEAETTLFHKDESTPRQIESQKERLRAAIFTARQTRQSALNVSSHVGKAIVLATKYLQAQEAALLATTQESLHG